MEGISALPKIDSGSRVLHEQQACSALVNDSVSSEISCASAGDLSNATTGDGVEVLDCLTINVPLHAKGGCS